MKYALIPPTQLLEPYSTRFHMCLAHLLLKSPQQQQYYARKAKGYIILDNSAYELRTSVASKTLAHMAWTIQPQEIALPDVLQDAPETLRLAKQAMELFRKQNFLWNPKYMGIPQGETPDEWICCMHELLQYPEVTVIGIPVLFEEICGRKVLIEAVREAKVPLEIHLLGWDRDLKKLSRYSCMGVRSVDSAKPIYYGLRRTRLDARRRLSRPKDYFTHSREISTTQRGIIQQNVQIFERACNGVL